MTHTGYLQTKVFCQLERWQIIGIRDVEQDVSVRSLCSDESINVLVI